MAKRTKKRPRGIIEPPKPVDAPAPARSRRQRFWLRMLVPLAALIVVIAVTVTWVSSTLGYYRDQQRIAGELKALGGKVVDEESGFSWLKPVAGDVRLADVVSVDLTEAAVEDRHLARIGELRKLRDLRLERRRVGDTSIKNLAGLHDLEQLNLSGTYVSDAGLRYLVELKRLDWLALNQTPITDAGLVYLRQLPNLQVLEVGAMKVTNKGVADLRRALPDTQILR